MGKGSMKIPPPPDNSFDLDGQDIPPPPDSVDELQGPSDDESGILTERGRGLISSVARPVLETAGGVGGAAIAGLGASPTVAGVIPAAAAGGALGFAGGKALADLVDRGLGIKEPIANISEAAGETVKDISSGAETEAMGHGTVKLLSGLEKVSKPIAKGAISFLSQRLGGVSDEASKVLETNAPLVLHYARSGIDAAKESAAEASKRFKSSIDGFMRDVSEKYEDLAINKVKEKYGPGWRMNVSDAVGDAISYARNDVGYGDPSNFVDEAGEKTFMKIEKSIASLKDANTDQVYKFQKRLNLALRQAAGKDSALHSVLSKIKGSLTTAMEKALPEVLEGNKVYRAGMELQEGLSKVSNADDAVRVINSAMKNKGATRDLILSLTEANPASKEALDDMLTAHAGSEYARFSRFLPNNGLLGAAYIGLGKLASELPEHPLSASILAAGTAGATSPRLYAEAAAGIPKLAKSAKKAVSGVPTQLIGISEKSLSYQARRILGY